MLKTLLIIAGVIAFLVVALVVYPALRGPIVFTMKNPPGGKIEATLLDSSPELGLRFKILLTQTEKEQTITVISLSRSLAKELSVSAPTGFAEDPLKPDDSEARDPEIMKFIEKSNAEQLRWSGKFILKPNQESILVIPSKSPTAGSGAFQFQYENKGRLGGSIAFFQVVVGSKSP